MIPEYRFAQIISRIIMLDFEKLKLRFTAFISLSNPLYLHYPFASISTRSVSLQMPLSFSRYMKNTRFSANS